MTLREKFRHSKTRVTWWMSRLARPARWGSRALNGRPSLDFKGRMIVGSVLGNTPIPRARVEGRGVMLREKFRHSKTRVTWWMSRLARPTAGVLGH